MFGNYISIRGQHLNEYRCSCGGGMTGGYNDKTVKRFEDHALIKLESAEWHSQDPTVIEYQTDVAVLDEIEAIVRKYKMNHWNRKKFTNMFVHDGESTGYHFRFNDAEISFSSQIYPDRYREKLAEIDSVIEAYIEKM